MINSLLIFFGAGLGGICRYWVSNATYLLANKSFPYGTLVVNISGSFLMGLLFALILGRFNGLGPQLRALLLIGFLGGYTTFSSFSIETLNLFESGAWLAATLNVAMSIFFCIFATWAGVLIGRELC